MYPGQHMSIEDNIFYAKRNIVDSIWKEANIEGIDITFPATKAVFEGAKIANLTQDQTTVINNLKHGWQFIFDFIDAPIDLSYVRQVHQLVSNNLVPDSGQLRYFDVYIGGTSWQPEIPDFDTAKAAIEKIANMEPGRERALKMFGYLCRSQLFSDSIWKEAIIEGVNITYPQAKVIVEYNQTVEGLTVTGTITVYNLKLAWNYLFEHLNSLVDFEFVAKINSILGASLVHNAGCIRNIPVGISGTAWQPEMPDFDTAKATIEKIANMEPGRERALKMFGYLCRSQLFSDGNKRTAQLVANKMLIADGRGILAIPPECKHDFGEKLKRFYETADDSELQKFLIETSIYN